jgi:hypothetical protein
MLKALAVLALMFPTFARAMPIPQFDKMAKPDRTEYVVDLIYGAADGLKQHGHADIAEKLLNLFDKGDGSADFSKNLTALRTAPAPNNQAPFEVEDAFSLTLKNNGIAVPLKFLLSVNKDFQPSQPVK